MKVCSLIEKNPDAEDHLPYMPDSRSVSSCSAQPTSPNAPAKDSSTLAVENLKPAFESSRESPQMPFPCHSKDSTHSTIAYSQISKSSTSVPESVATSLLGPGVKGFSMTPSLFEEALRFRTEQERTEQERIRLEIISKTESIFKFAVEHNVPPESLSIVTRCAQPDQDKTSSFPPRASGQVPFGGNPQQMASIGALEPLNPRSSYPSASPLRPIHQYENSNNASSVDPVNFRFGTSSSLGPQSYSDNISRRPRSPAKLGAMAVASLANPLTPYRPAHRTIPLHQRHYSMPTEIALSDHKSTRLSVNPREPHFSPANFSKVPDASTSSMRVRPSPAQPLHKQTSGGQHFSQDDLTHHQQVIQFHHWISENPGGTAAMEKSDSKKNTTAFLQHSHKRHKSSDVSMRALRSGSVSDTQ